MKNNLQFDFTVDKAAKTVLITREFDADLSLVWDALPKQSSLTNGWHLNPSCPKQNLWILKLADAGFMQW